MPEQFEEGGAIHEDYKAPGTSQPEGAVPVAGSNSRLQQLQAERTKADSQVQKGQGGAEKSQGII